MMAPVPLELVVVLLAVPVLLLLMPVSAAAVAVAVWATLLPLSPAWCAVVRTVDNILVVGWVGVGARPVPPVPRRSCGRVPP